MIRCNFLVYQGLYKPYRYSLGSFQNPATTKFCKHGWISCTFIILHWLHYTNLHTRKPHINYLVIRDVSQWKVQKLRMIRVSSDIKLQNWPHRVVFHPQPPMEHTCEEAAKHLFQLHIVAPAAYKDGKCYLRQIFQPNNDVTILKHNCHVFFSFIER